MIKSLQETIGLMESADYKERFLAEYLQTKIRYEKLHKLIVRYHAGTLDFELSNPIELLEDQAKYMGQYLFILEVRAENEKINLQGEQP